MHLLMSHDAAFVKDQLGGVTTLGGLEWSARYRAPQGMTKDKGSYQSTLHPIIKVEFTLR